MPAENPGVTVAAKEEVQRLWEDQLIDYQSIHHLAKEEEKALHAGRFEHLHHTQSQRQRLAQCILEREQAIRSYRDAFQPQLREVLAEITATIETVLTLDSQNRQRLEAEYEAVAGVLQKLKAGRAVLHQYKPLRENLPHFLNRMV